MNNKVRHAADFEFDSPPDTCSYLPREVASLKYRQFLTMDAAQYDAYLARGWRRHGCYFFRPNCPTCVKCRSLRVRVGDFRPSKSQRRCWIRNQDVSVRMLDEPELSERHLELFNGYHRDMHRRRGWPDRVCDAYEYAAAFLLGRFAFAREFQYWRAGHLIGVGLVDQTRRSSSSVYFYHDPDWRSDGPGVFSMLAELRYAAECKLDYHYLGYWISDCPSMAYKSRYGPHELLQEYVADDQLPCWQLPG